MKFTSKKLPQKQKGQGMTEYVIIVVLIAIALIAAVTLYGDRLDNIIRGSKGSVDKVGEDGGLPGEVDTKKKNDDDD